MKKLSEAMFVLERAGILVEEYPGKGYTKPIRQMIDEISKAGKLGTLRDRLVTAVADDLNRALPMHMRGVQTNTDWANTINLGTGPSNQREAKEKAREVFDNARNETGIPVYLRKYKPVGRNGYGEWLAYFNVFSDDYGHIKTDEMVRLLSNNDEYWEILDDLYTKRSNKTVRHEPSDEEKMVSSAGDRNTLGVLNEISRTPLTKKDWDRFASSTVARQISALSTMSEEKAASRRHAILLMIAKRYQGGFSEYLSFRDGSEVDIRRMASFLRGCGLYLPSFPTYRDARDGVTSMIAKVREYFKDDLEILEQ